MSFNIATDKIIKKWQLALFCVEEKHWDLGKVPKADVIIILTPLHCVES